MAERGRPGRPRHPPRPLRRVQRVAAYAVVVRDDQILLSRLAPRVTDRELWTLPGGGVEHGEDPRDAVVREVHEETGLDARIGASARVYSLHQDDTWRHGHRADAHSLRIVYEGWVPPDSPAPHVVEVDGSTAEAAWQPLAAVLDGTLPTVSLVSQALAGHRAARVQRTSVRALIVVDDQVLLARNAAHDRYAGQWALPGGGIEHGESPRGALARELAEETGLVCRIGDVLDVFDAHFEGTAPSGRHEDFHTVQIVFDADLATAPSTGPETGPADGPATPRVVEVGGTTDAVAWVALADVGDAAHPVRPHVAGALAARDRRHSPPGTIGI